MGRVVWGALGLGGVEVSAAANRGLCLVLCSPHQVGSCFGTAKAGKSLHAKFVLVQEMHDSRIKMPHEKPPSRLTDLDNYLVFAGATPRGSRRG